MSENWVYGWEPRCMKDKIWNYELICDPKSEEDPFISIVWLCQISHSNHTCCSTNKISLQAFCVHTLPSSTIGTLQSHTHLLTPWLCSHPMHVATYQKPCALIHISICICILQSCTCMLRPPVMCICQSFIHIHSFGTPYWYDIKIPTRLTHTAQDWWCRLPRPKWSSIMTKIMDNLLSTILVPDSTLEYFLS